MWLAAAFQTRLGVLQQDVTDRRDVADAAHERLGERHLEQGAAMALEQTHELGGGGAEVLSALGTQEEKRGTARGLGLQATGRAVLARGVLLVDQRRDVGLVLDPSPAIVAARVPGDDAGAVDDADRVFRGDHLQHALHAVVRHRVIVEVEAQIRRLADADGQLLLAGKRDVRQRQEARLLLADRFADRAGLVLAPGAVHGRSLAPGLRLRVEIGEVDEAARGEEGFTQPARAGSDESGLRRQPARAPRS